MTTLVNMQYNIDKLKGAIKMNKEKKQVIQVRVTKEEKEAVKKLAEQAHLSISSYVRSQLLSAK